MAKKRIAIFGGGPSALATAFEITQTQDWADKFEIDIYAMGYRLGGKCASGRDPDKDWRNEEHGLHILGGFYHNTFQILRPLYAEWSRLFPDTSIPFEEAFFPHNGFVLGKKDAQDHWGQLTVCLPPDERQPGVNPEPISVQTMLRQIYRWIEKALKRALTGKSILDWCDHPDTFQAFSWTPSHQQISAAKLLQNQSGSLAQRLEIPLDGVAYSELEADAKKFDHVFALWLATLPEISNEDVFGILDFYRTVAMGIWIDRLLSRGFDVVNHLEAKEWLRKHGASELAVRCPLFIASYHYLFGYIDGDPAKANIAAGAGMRAMLRFTLTYHQAVFMHMNGGMGEVFVVPFYEVLRARGVRFHFFTLLKEIVPDSNGNISEIHLVEQALLKEPLHPYQPLIEMPLSTGGVRRCWPVAPLFDQLVVSAEHHQTDFESYYASANIGTQRILRAGHPRDGFDLCVLAISVGTLPLVTGKLSARSEDWKEMLAHSSTTPTIAAQIWRTDYMQTALGWSAERLFTGYELPMSTWADMSFQIAPLTKQGAKSKANSMHSFCGPVGIPPETTPKDESFPVQELDRANQITNKWLFDNCAHVLPGISNYGGHYDPANEVGRFVKMNSDPASLYVITPPDTPQYRIKTNMTTFRNLLVAGDWTSHNFDLGAVEGAIMSGRMCSREICGYPKVIYGETDSN